MMAGAFSMGLIYSLHYIQPALLFPQFIYHATLSSWYMTPTWEWMLDVGADEVAAVLQALPRDVCVTSILHKQK